MASRTLKLKWGAFKITSKWKQQNNVSQPNTIESTDQSEFPKKLRFQRKKQKRLCATPCSL